MPGTLKQYTEKNNKHLSFYIVVVENEVRIIPKEEKEEKEKFITISICTSMLQQQKMKHRLYKSKRKKEIIPKAEKEKICEEKKLMRYKKVNQQRIQ